MAAGDVIETNHIDFTQVIKRFLDTMEAVAELASFAGDHVRQLDNEDAAIESIAAKRLPHATPEQHRAAVVLVKKTFQAMKDARLAATEEADGEPDEAAVQAVVFPVLDKLREELEQVSRHPDAFIHYVVAYSQAIVRPRRLPVLYSALLTTSVGNFEVLVSGIVREFLRLKPEATRSDDARYSLADIEGFESIQEFREYCAERYAESLLRGSFEDWMDWFEKRLKITLNELTSDPVHVREVFQRRHLIVHNGGTVNRTYLLKMPEIKPAPAMGSQLAVDEDYLSEAVDSLIATGALLSALVMRRLLPSAPEDENADKLMSDACYEFLTQGRWSLVIKITSGMIEGCTSDYSKLVMMVNRWVARKRLNGLDSIRVEVDAWQVSALKPRFLLAKLALLDDVQAAYELAQDLLKGDDLSESDWVRWPLLAEVRAYEASSKGGEPDDASAEERTYADAATG